MPQQNLSTVNLIPGINKNITEYEAGNRFVNGDKVRFQNGKPEKIGGWRKFTFDLTKGVARDGVSWNALDGSPFLAVGTNERLQVFRNDKFYDITPYSDTLSDTDGLTTVSGSNLVELRWTLHTIQVGNSIVFDSAVTVGGLVLLGEYVITSIIDANTVEFHTPTNASADETDGGGSYTVGLILPKGLEYNLLSFGYGSGYYGQDSYGESGEVGETGTITRMRQWSLDNWGEDLIASPRGGKIYVWDTSVGIGSRSVAITNAPERNNFVLVTPSTRQIMSFGCINEAGEYDPLAYRWCSVENYNDWLTTSTSTAGDDRVSSGSEFIGAELSKADIIAFTDTSAYRLYQTPSVPGSWSQDMIAVTGGLISPHASINVDGIVFWMSKDNFYRYDGRVSLLDCTISSPLFDKVSEISLNPEQKEMVFCGLCKKFNEIIWLYPAKGSLRCNRYVIYNYAENLWYDGNLDRSVWVDADSFERPIAINRDGVPFEHEFGYNADGSSLLSFVETGYFDIQEGRQMMFIDKFVPDMELEGNQGHTITLKTKKYPQGNYQTSKTYTVLKDSGKINVRARGRQLSLRWTSSGLDSYFRFGKPRLSVTPDGER